jgi:N-acetyl-anhydromuramyl-L-alanine amidase AmpD
MRRHALIISALLLASSTGWAQEKPPVQWVPANPTYFRTGRGGESIRYVVIHTIEGSASSGINTFRSGGRKVSAHYIVAADGAITQMVKDSDTAWHAGEINGRSIGIEHAGFADRNQWTMVQYRASARITRWACDTYGIPKDRQHIIGHSEAPGATHHDPGRFFDWTLYMRLVNEGASVDEAGPEVQAIRPTNGQTMGSIDTQGGGTGLLVEWSTKGPRPQASARVFLEEVGGALRYESESLSGELTRHRVTARLEDGKTYRWRVRVWDGTREDETDWVTFRTDFDAPTIEVVYPKPGATVQATPGLRWRYADPDGTPQVSYRVWLDDDEDHTRVIGDTKELNGAASAYYLRTVLKPGKTYWWRAMGYDGRGNVAITGWTPFTTAADFVDVASAGVSVTALAPADGAQLPQSERATLRWAFHSGEHTDQQAFRVQVAQGEQLVVDEQYSTTHSGYRARPLPPGTYRWRVRVWDGETAKATDWRTFVVTAPGTGLTGHIGQ